MRGLSNDYYLGHVKNDDDDDDDAESYFLRYSVSGWDQDWSDHVDVRPPFNLKTLKTSKTLQVKK